MPCQRWYQLMVILLIVFSFFLSTVNLFQFILSSQLVSEVVKDFYIIPIERRCLVSIGVNCWRFSHHVFFLPSTINHFQFILIQSISLSLMSSRISALSLLNGGALSTSVSSVGESSRHYLVFLSTIKLLQLHLFLLHQLACL